MVSRPDQHNLLRYPQSKDSSLKAWNAADELLLEHISQVSGLDSRNPLIINDQFGALSVCLSRLMPAYWTDSYLSKKATQLNLKNANRQQTYENELKLKLDKTLNFERTESLEPQRPFDLIVIRIPKHNSLLQFQLEQIKPWLSRDAQIFAAGMTKEIHKSTLKIFEECIGRTTTSLAKKKARLVFTQFDKPQRQISRLKHYDLSNTLLKIFGLPGVFSRDKLDIGASVMLKHLPELQPGQTVIDIGCGNGVLSAVLANRHSDCQFILTDESLMAMQSAQLTFERNQLNNGQFFHTDVLENVPLIKADQVICNPPFHQQNVQTIEIAQKMFKQASFFIRSQGELRVVANRHLKYASLIGKYFQSVKPISADSKFTVWLAKRPKTKN